MKNPLVTIVIPALNEAEFIEPCLDTLMNQDIGADCIEILVVDGGSTDGTKKFVRQYSERHPNVKLLENDKKYTVFAFNIGIKNSHHSSNYITFLNCHAVYSPDRLRKAIDALAAYNADVVGGRSYAVSRRETLFGKAVALALRSFFGTGSRFRRETGKPRFVDTASGCLYKKEMLAKVGFFNEKLIYSQDIELNRRIRMAGGKILYLPELQTTYKSRVDLRSFIKHTFRNGLWVILPFRYSDVVPVSFRHIVPGGLAIAFLLMTIGALFGLLPPGIPIAILFSYLVGNLAVSIAMVFREKSLSLLLVLPLVFILLHAVYACGSLWGFVQLLFGHK
jgi:succinoglycan biosynthesis protein ExoA